MSKYRYTHWTQIRGPLLSTKPTMAIAKEEYDHNPHGSYPVFARSLLDSKLLGASDSNAADDVSASYQEIANPEHRAVAVR